MGVLSGIKSNKMYLYGIPFTVIVDHEPLVAMYNSHSREVTTRVAKHKSKLLAFNFKVQYQPGVQNPCDYGSRNPPPKKAYSAQERDELGIEEEEEDQEILVCRQEELVDAITLPMLREHTKTDKVLATLLEDVKAGRLSGELKQTEYKNCFEELSMQDGILMKGDRLVIPNSLRPDVLEAAHMGHPGKDGMLRQLRKSTWWPGMTRDVTEFENSCNPCKAANPHNRTPPMTEREIPNRPWQHVSADYKGPIAGKYYFHVMIDNYSRWPEVAVVKSTGFDKLQPRLEETFAIHGVPETVTHDNGPCYNSANWRDFAKKWGFITNPCTPEHPQANGVAERFMQVIIKVVHTAIAAGQDPKIEIQRRLFNYRNTPHPSTGKTPAELMIRRPIRTRIPAILKTLSAKVDREARKQNRKINQERKIRYDGKHRTKKTDIQVGDRVLVKQDKTTTRPPFDPDPYSVTEVKGTQITAERDGQVKKRNQAKMKKLERRPERLRIQSKDQQEEDSSEDEVEINLGAQKKTSIDEPTVGQQIRTEPDRGDRMEETGRSRQRVAEATTQNEKRNEEQNRRDSTPGSLARTPIRKSTRARQKPSRYQTEDDEKEVQGKRLSPRKRRRVKSAAANKGIKERWLIWNKEQGWQ